MDKILGVAGQVLAKVAPMLAAGFGGPLAGASTSAIISALGLAPDATPGDVAQAVANATPDQLLALKQADAEFAIAMKKLDLDADALAGKDRDSARAREIAVRDRTPMVLSAATTLGFFGILAIMAFHDVPMGSATLLNIMIGSLGAGWVSVLSYYFGSSAGSAAKTNALADIAGVGK